jgi:glycosyltransferase involved in cell wall biosynthesis
VPYAPSTVFLGAEKAKLSSREGTRRRVALIADGIGSMHGVTHTIEQIRERGVPGFDIDVIGTDAGVDRRLPAAAELELPFYAGMTLGVPGLPDLVETLADGGYDLVHVTAPGPAGVAATLLGRITGVPLLASYHTELAAYAGMRSSDGGIEAIARAALGAFYGAPGFILSPSPAADGSLAELGVDAARVGRWERGVDTDRFDPAKADRDAYPGELKVLYAGRMTREKGVDLLAESFLRARRADPRLHLLLAGGGPEEDELRERLGEHATFLGWLGGEELARAYASADVFLFASSTDTYGQVILEAGASGLPVVAVAEGGPAALVENRHTGLLCRPDPDHMAGALLQLASSPALRRQLGAAAAETARQRSWERAMASSRPATGGRWTLARRQAGRHWPRSPEARASRQCLSTMDRSTIPPITSIASSPGSTSTSGFWNWPRTRRCHCWSGSASAASTPPTSTSSSWSGSPASSTSSTPGSTPAVPMASPRASRSMRSRLGCWSSTGASTPASAASCALPWRRRGSASSPSTPPARRSVAKSTLASTSRSSRR